MDIEILEVDKYGLVTGVRNRESHKTAKIDVYYDRLHFPAIVRQAISMTMLDEVFSEIYLKKVCQRLEPEKGLMVFADTIVDHVKDPLKCTSILCRIAHIAKNRSLFIAQQYVKNLNACIAIDESEGSTDNSEEGIVRNKEPDREIDVFLTIDKAGDIKEELLRGMKAFVTIEVSICVKDFVLRTYDEKSMWQTLNEHSIVRDIIFKNSVLLMSEADIEKAFERLALQHGLIDSSLRIMIRTYNFLVDGKLFDKANFVRKKIVDIKKAKLPKT